MTGNAENELKKSLKTIRNGEVNLEQEKIYQFLRDNGVDTVLLAGEWVWYSGNGCLGEVAQDFRNNGFEVKGVKGCLYPSVPKVDSELLKKLYQDQVNPLSI